MTQHIKLRDNYIAVRVPDNAYIAYVKGNTIEGYKDTGAIYWERELDGSYTFLFLTSAATEEDCSKVVGKFNNGAYRNYDYQDFDPANDMLDFYLTATESFTSLLQSVGITEGVWAVLEKK